MQRRGNLGAKADEITSDAVEASGNRLDVPLSFLPLLLVVTSPR
jgi:hypothetical protein